ncbi:hypothetical protein FZEAL_8031 [Fusarium zealandicum]|uniref:Calcineurin-like phosphoesterase domain-containing protein n=1 Tax=Fusarium zealandicum TaxID=1053134 RepID=A0A8H4XHX0_9HYPO|nr:hypothetical protein FZEAL_8031 [Fusarium zealandicum]
MGSPAKKPLKRGSHLQEAPRIQVLSDLHLEFAQQYASYIFPATAPYLLLGGDIGRLVDYQEYLKFMEAHVHRYKKVFLVLGNHEFHGLDYEKALETARHLVAEPTLADTVVLLHRVRWDDPESSLTILGCTLWSAIPEHAYSVVQSKVKDFRNIRDWSVQKHNTLHEEEHSWLREQVTQLSSEKEYSIRKLLVVTHHAPRVEGTSRPQHAGNPWTCAFATDLLDQDWEDVKVWVFGHTHYSTDLLLSDGMRLVANQRGYVLPDSDVVRESRKDDGSHTFDSSLVIYLTS